MSLPTPPELSLPGLLHAIPPSARVLFVVGPTATGKSDVAIELAQSSGAAIVSADSRQVYQGLDLGTGKVAGRLDLSRSRTVRVLGTSYVQAPFVSAGIDHWLLDVADPRHVFTLAEYQLLAFEAIGDITRRNKPVIVVGGTGLYVQSLQEALVMPAVPPDAELRAHLETLAPEALRDQLLRLDPAAGEQVDLNNPRRMIRALEIVRAVGPLAQARTRLPVPFTQASLGLTLERARLVERITQRLDARLAAGMLDEVQHLLEQGVPAQRLLDLGLEYRSVTEHLLGPCTASEMRTGLLTAIGRFARRQGTWFRNHGEVHWYDNPHPLKAAGKAWLAASTPSPQV